VDVAGAGSGGRHELAGAFLPALALDDPLAKVRRRWRCATVAASSASVGIASLS
jgi:hypothetical protein